MKYIKPLLIAIVAALCSLSMISYGSGSAVEFIGDYGKVESATGEHCSGYDIMLWKYKNSIIGFINHHRGLCGDPPMGMLEEVQYSASTGSLSFRAKISDGCMLKDNKCTPTKDVILFSGALRDNLIKGNLSWFREGNKTALKAEELVLPRDKTERGQNYATLEEWNNYWKPIINFRGPKW